MKSAPLVVGATWPPLKPFGVIAAGFVVIWVVYGAFLSWEANAAPPEDWQGARDRDFRLDVIRGLGSGVALVCFEISLATSTP